MTNTEKFDMVNDLLTEIQCKQPCYKNGNFTGNCGYGCRYLAYSEEGEEICMIDAMLDEAYRDFGMWRTNNGRSL